MNIFKSFRRDERGVFAALLSVALLPVMGATMLAVDYSTTMQARGKVQSIVDSAVLAGATAATTDSDSVRTSRATTWFDTQMSLAGITGATRTASISSGKLEMSATFTQKSTLKILGFTETQVTVKATAAISQEAIRRVLDVAMCIDATGSMQNTINSVKAKAQSFSDDLNTALRNRGLESFDYTRIRVIFYRDFAVDNGQMQYYWGWGWYQNPVAISKSGFFIQPTEKTQLQNFIGTQNAAGGGDLPESGYECIHEGMKSAWFKKGDPIPNTTYKAEQVYPVIVLWTDADALPFNHYQSVNSGQYPADMPRDAATFLTKWNTSTVIDQANRMLVQFGPCSWNSWSTARAMPGYMCGGSLSDGNTNMTNKIADAMVVRYQNKLTRLSK